MLLSRRLLKGYLLSACAFVWRRIMFRTTFIAITGSVGKTTATDTLGAILSAHAPTNWTPGGANARSSLARQVLRTRFRHRFMVIEVGTRAPGALRRAAWMIAPDVAVVLRVLNIHSDAFPTLQDMAREKEQLLSRLGRRGVAVLNAGDDLVAAMAARCRGTVRTFGLVEGSWLRASEASAQWPERLKFVAHCDGGSAAVATNFVGTQLLESALAALAVAVHCGVPLARAAAALRGIHPVPGRMFPMPLGNGVTVIRDEYSHTLPTLLRALDTLRDSQAVRRVVMIGDVFDTGLSVRPRLRETGRLVATAADVAIFLGKEASVSARSAVDAGMRPGSAHGFKTLPEATEFLRSELRAGDLVLLRGWERRHPERAILAQIGEVGCRKEVCKRRCLCEDCPELGFVPASVLTPNKT